MASEHEKPSREGWWWVWSVCDRAVKNPNGYGWKPVWVYSSPCGTGHLGFDSRSSGRWEPAAHYQWGGPVTREVPAQAARLWVHAGRRALIDAGVTPLHGSLVIRDDLGREVDVAGFAWGKCAGDLGVFACNGMPVGDETIATKAPLEADKTYLVLVIEHPDEARTHE
jgi:hypothetical protein